MKNIVLTAIAVLAFTQIASAASISVVQSDAGGGNTLYSISLVAPVTDVFNAFGYSATPTGGAQFQNVAVAVLTDVAATPKTFINAFLEAPPLFGGFGLSLAGKTNTASQQSFDAGLLGANIDASAGIFLGNVVLPTAQAGNYRVVLQSAGNQVGDALTGQLGIPEPSTMALAGLSLIGLVLRRRNG